MKIQSATLRLKQKCRQAYSSDDYKSNLITRIFPSIRYGRDYDLDRYVAMREAGASSAKWNFYYQKLKTKYTDQERRQLIRSLRKTRHAFSGLFNSVLDSLYDRLIQGFKNQIEALLWNLEPQTGSVFRLSRDEPELLQRIENCLNILSSDKYQAMQTLDFLESVADRLSYKTSSLAKAAELLHAYFDGTLFDTQGIQEVYSFDINEERRRLGLPEPKMLENHPTPNRQQAPLTLRVLLTQQDLDNISIIKNGQDEYDSAFIYLEKYTPFAHDRDFATKIFVYSQKHQTNHYKIFDAVRKGVSFKYHKDRIFDDIFKILSEGRYVYNIAKERITSLRLRHIQPPVRQPLSKPKASAPQAAPPVSKPKVKVKRRIRRHRRAAVSPAARKIAPIPRLRVKPQRLRPKIQTRTGHPVKQPPAVLPVTSTETFTAAVNNSILTVDSMIKNLTAERKAQKRLKKEYKKRLPRYLAKSFDFVSRFHEGERDKNLKDYIIFVLKYYNAILTSDSETDRFTVQIEAFHSSFHETYMAIIQCFYDLKTDFLTKQF